MKSKLFEKENDKNRSGNCKGMKEETEVVYAECCIYVRQDDKLIMCLDAGMDAVIAFSKLADKGIFGSIHTEKGWYCNRTVIIAGKDLICFVRNTYPNIKFEELNKIDNETIYTIVADDFS